MIVTISREFGAAGGEVAERLAHALGWTLVDNELIDEVSKRVGLPPEEVAEREERAPSFIERLTRVSSHTVTSTPTMQPYRRACPKREPRRTREGGRSSFSTVSKVPARRTTCAASLTRRGPPAGMWSGSISATAAAPNGCRAVCTIRG